MNNTVRVALPGYNAFTDTNLDHFAVYGDVDNVLIKRKTSSSQLIAAGATATIAHNLGYVPFFMVYEDQFDNNNYYIVNNQYNVFSIPPAVCGADTTNLYITNNDGAAHNFYYDIFYDDMSQTGTPSIVESAEVFKVARPGKSTNSKNPNDYIVHSDLNNCKILGQYTQSVTIAGSTEQHFSPNIPVDNPVKYFIFVKCPDGKTMLLGNGSQLTYDEANNLVCHGNRTDFYIKNFSSTSITVTATLVLYGSGQDSTPADVTVDNTGMILAVAKAGKNVLTAINPDDYNFHSKFPTLKYHVSGTYSITTNVTSVQTIAHNLGYVPFFIGFVSDFEGVITPGAAAIMPYYAGHNTVVVHNSDIAAFIYADATNIYLKTYFQSSASGGANKTFNFYYKIFKNNLGL